MLNVWILLRCRNSPGKDNRQDPAKESWTVGAESLSLLFHCCVSFGGCKKVLSWNWKGNKKGEKWKSLKVGNKKDENRRQERKQQTLPLCFWNQEKAETNGEVGTSFEQFVLICISKTSGSLVDLPFLWQAFEGIVLVVRRPSGQLGKNKSKEGLWDQCDQIIPQTLLQLQCEQWSEESRILSTSELFVSSILAIQELLSCPRVECGWATLSLLDWYLFVFVFVFACLYLLPRSQWGRGAI